MRNPLGFFSIKNIPDFIPKKQLGQNFLIDPNITEKILASCSFAPSDIVLEIGPGLGVLTRRIASQVQELIAIETDRRLCEQLRQAIQSQNVKIIHADFLKYNFAQLPPQKIKVVGNLPYYICSPIIARVLKERKRFSSLFVTVQREFGQRLAAKIDTKAYSAFSCFVQYFAQGKLLFKIKNTCFKPVPKVDSCFLQLDIFSDPPYKAEDEEFLFTMIRQAFQQRRKTIVNALLPLMGREKLYSILDSLRLNPKSRAENLRVKDFVDLANKLIEFRKINGTLFQSSKCSINWQKFNKP